MSKVQRYYYAQTFLLLALYTSTIASSLALLATGISGIMPGLILLALMAVAHTYIGKGLFGSLSRLYRAYTEQNRPLCYISLLLGDASAMALNAVTFFLPLLILNALATLIAGNDFLHLVSVAGMVLSLTGMTGMHFKFSTYESNVVKVGLV
jgi:hypothetical protein